MAGDLEFDIVASSAEQPVHVPAEIAGASVDAVAAAEQPEAAARLVLDPEIVADRPDLAVAAPPFAMDALGAVAGDDRVQLCPRQAKRRGGWSGSSATTFDSGSGRASSRTGRFQAGQPVGVPSGRRGTTARSGTSLSTGAIRNTASAPTRPAS